MFQPGDKLRYTGNFRHVKSKDYGDLDEWVFVRCSSDYGSDQNNVIHAFNPTGTVHTKPSYPCAFYAGDMELVPQGPELYEEWFKS